MYICTYIYIYNSIHIILWTKISYSSHNIFFVVGFWLYHRLIAGWSTCSTEVSPGDDRAIRRWSGDFFEAKIGRYPPNIWELSTRNGFFNMVLFDFMGKSCFLGGGNLPSGNLFQRLYWGVLGQRRQSWWDLMLHGLTFDGYPRIAPQYGRVSIRPKGLVVSDLPNFGETPMIHWFNLAKIWG